MMARARLVLPALLVAALLAGCGESTGSGAGAGSPTDAAAVERARELGTTPQYVYVTEIPGFTVAPQSVGVSGDAGFQAVYVRRDGAQITLTVDTIRLTDSTCPSLALDAAPSGGGTCERDAELWYRAQGSAHEYAVMRGSLEVRLSADTAHVDRPMLLAAARAAHPADAIEFDAVLPRRGDLPTTGDGAPIDPPRVGG
ncbi:hypothetical protein [Streptomyces sp. SID3343]|uniref:hypothetical protein n=1 Tax=Streptomyces sp. SID3343 TaxID=2690260 RepID=UPI00136D2A0B|nr:hypothetical protein [Streptomyces sp. SID3343]MYW00423.1 hypothetical protein [Streptomyces sp. SID3343]